MEFDLAFTEATAGPAECVDNNPSLGMKLRGLDRHAADRQDLSGEALPRFVRSTIAEILNTVDVRATQQFEAQKRVRTSFQISANTRNQEVSELDSRHNRFAVFAGHRDLFRVGSRLRRRIARHDGRIRSPDVGGGAA